MWVSRLIFLAFFALQSALFSSAQESAEKILENEISDAKNRFRVAKSRELLNAIRIRIFVVSFDQQLSEADGLSLAETKANDYVQLPTGNFAKIISAQDFTPGEFDRFLEILRSVLQSEAPGPGAMCHEPTHLAVFFGKDHRDPTKERVLLSISLSIHCQNFIFPFVSNLGNQAIATGDSLRTELLKLVGYPQTELQRFEKRADEGLLKR